MNPFMFDKSHLSKYDKIVVDMTVMESIDAWEPKTYKIAEGAVSG